MIWAQDVGALTQILVQRVAIWLAVLKFDFNFFFNDIQLSFWVKPPVSLPFGSRVAEAE